MKYRVAGGTLTVKARSSVHDTVTTWDSIAGEIDADPDALATAKASFSVDMTKFDAGDWLKNRKLRKDFDMDAHPRATFTLTKVDGVVRDGAKFKAAAEGTLAWRGKDVVLSVTGEGTLDDASVSATGSFVLDIRRL
ncbi:MAG TPA: YceI family protein, partial [Kofleriaceae bacterium]|nr:YceI family protein [Kofleriaceae bacterium]